MEIRTREDLEGLSGLVFPGGESTVMGKFLIEWGMMDRVRELIRSGMPVFGTCAGPHFRPPLFWKTATTKVCFSFSATTNPVKGIPARFR